MPRSTHRSSFRRLGRAREGTVAVELAIVGPVFILLMFGMIAYGIYFGAAHSMQQLAADAARASVAGLDEDERTRLAERFVSLNSSQYMLIDPEAVTISAAGSARDASQFLVSVSYDARQLPIWNLHVPLPLPEQMIMRTSTIRVGGV
ncbi:MULTISPECIES: TadE/TadG family type IV pilus assembly protein [unclassified Roseitalea]|uniref:TadE/TadG family type IV pilus assembly protein n=1 Tax=unclassified Roseitalea TaxID=2639107 RepID=UPI00273F4AA2|nr:MULTISPECIES: TadE/TadG family type IV pilus assembly protein [unclassified Roseitalea]